MDYKENHGIVLPNLVFKIKKVHPDAVIPARAHEFDAGLDLFSVEDVEIPPGEARAVDTGLAMALPNGWEAQIRSRSGLALNHWVSVLNDPGTIDSAYRGNVKVILFNHQRDPNKFYEVHKGDKIAQMTLSPVYFLPNVSIVDELDETDRGNGGFGSSGR